MGSAVEAIETEELVRQAAEDIANDFYDKSKPLETLINEVHDKFKTKGVKLQKLGGHDEYNVSSIGKSNINTWKKSARISDGKGSITSVSISILLSEGGVCWTTSFIKGRQVKSASFFCTCSCVEGDTNRVRPGELWSI